MEAHGLSELSGPSQVQTRSVTMNFDEYTFQIDLHDRLVSVRSTGETGQIVWQSPEDWQITEAFFSDLNRDGQQDLSLLVWRSYRPWPVDRLLRFEGLTKDFHDRNGLSCQIIMLKWDGSRFKEAWAGSALASPIHDLQVLDLDGDGYQELAALEQPYDAKLKGSSVVVWRWNGFGFSLDERLSGRYTNLSTLYDREKSWLLIQ